jgi:hypothetical protein
MRAPEPLKNRILPLIFTLFQRILGVSKRFSSQNPNPTLQRPFTYF